MDKLLAVTAATVAAFYLTGEDTETPEPYEPWVLEIALDNGGFHTSRYGELADCETEVHRIRASTWVEATASCHRGTE